MSEKAFYARSGCINKVFRAETANNAAKNRKSHAGYHLARILPEKSRSDCVNLRTGGKKVCLFAAFDPRLAAGASARILAVTISYLRALRNCGFQVHVALSGAERFDPADDALFRECGIELHLRPNSGHDFGAWQYLIDLGCADGAEQILLTNDSVYGPVSPLAPIFAVMDGGNDVWSMVESREGRWHLQSWFLCFSAAGFASSAVRQVMRMPFAAMNRDQIVLHGELGLGAAIQADGLSWDARWKAPTRRLRRLVPGNPMHLDYMSVVRSGAVPFLKADLLRENPARIGWQGRWPTLLQANSSLSAEAIQEALSTRPYRPSKEQTPIMRALYAAISSDWPEAAKSAFRRQPS